MTLHQATEYLQKTDPIFRKIIHDCGDALVFDNTDIRDIYGFLLSSVISQQLSTKAADTIYKRFLDIFLGDVPSPQMLINTDTDTLRSVGLSMQKAGYLHNIAHFAIKNGLNDEKIQQMPDDVLIKHLTQIKGVGQWTAEMVLMFALKRPDIFTTGDLAIAQTATQLYALPPSGKPQIQALLHLSQQWQPYRTYACLYLWKYRDLGLLKNRGVNFI